MPAIVYNTRYDYRKYRNAAYEEYAGTPADIDYLKRYPDVAAFMENEKAAGKADRLRSGYDHYMIAGKSEGRTYDLSLNDAPVASGSLKKVLIVVAIGIVGFILYKKFVKGK